MKLPFIHLHNHTEYSLLDGAIKIDNLLQQAIDYKMPAISITDHGNIFGAISFYEKAIKKGIKPIIGCEVYMAPNNRFEKIQSETPYHLILLVKDEIGYKNLMKLITIGYLEGFYYKMRIDKEILAKYSQGLLCLSGCLKSEISNLLIKEKEDKAKEIIGEYVDIFGKENFYLELQNHHIKEEEIVNKKLVEMSKELNLPLVVTNDCHYLKQSDAKAHEVLLCIQTKKTIKDKDRMKFSSDEFYFKSPEEMAFLFKEVPEALKNTIEIEKKCNLKLDFNKLHLPNYKVPTNYTLSSYLEEIASEGLKRRYKEIKNEMRERLYYELNIIKKMQYEGYFLIIWDIVNFALEKNIPVGPGRGSAAGSLVSYVLGITNIDPLKYGLIFERFLNPERISMPDIDIDFCFERREEILDYIKNKYGTQNVAQIITFGTMMAKAVIRDVGRVLDFNYNEINNIAKLIPNILNITIDLARKTEPKLDEIIKQDKYKELFLIAETLEGLTRHASTHAAGIVIVDDNLVNHLPLCIQDKEIITQFDMKSVEKIGILKIDILGLKTLTVMKNTLEIANIKEININELDDKETYKLLSNGETIGVFQLESPGMRDLLRKLKPEIFEDLIALVALYRPGAIEGGMIDDFIKRKHKHKPVDYLVPELEEILKETYGVIIYQEQVMSIANKLGGASLGQADILRRAMSKKDPEVMEQQRQKFINGAVKNKIPASKAEKVFDLIVHFAGYGFNKSHSAAYALIAYKTAYLKTHFPKEFMASLLSSEFGNPDKISLYINECRKMKIEVLPPDINHCYAKFTIVENKIRFGLSAVKNVGEQAVISIIKARENGKFKSLYDFCERVDLRVVNKRVIESLIKSGAFDFLGYFRSQLVAQLDYALEISQSIQQDKNNGQSSLFETFEQEGDVTYKKLPNIPEWHENELLKFEKEMLGVYLSTHPLSKYEQEIKFYTTHSSSEIKDLQDGDLIAIAGIVNEIKENLDKKNRRMGFVNLEDLEGNIEVIIYSDLYSKLSLYLLTDSILYIKGRVSKNDKTAKIVATEIMPLEKATEKLTKSIRIKLITTGLEEEILLSLKKIISRHKGQCPLYLDFFDSHNNEIVVSSSQKYYILPSKKFYNEVTNLLGENSVQFVL